MSHLPELSVHLQAEPESPNVKILNILQKSGVTFLGNSFKCWQKNGKKKLIFGKKYGEKGVDLNTTLLLKVGQGRQGAVLQGAVATASGAALL